MANKTTKPRTRREFIATGAAATALSGFPFVRTGQAKEPPIRVGVVGAGGRGTGACANALVAHPDVEIVAMADIAEDRVTQSLGALRDAYDLQDEALQKRIKVNDETRFVGPDSFKQVMELDLDYVILSTPPGFRPLHYAEAVKRGRHVFAEKPLATDPVGCRKIRASAEEAKQKGLSVVVGLNARHDHGTMEAVDRIHGGAVGEITSGSIYRLGGGLWHRGLNPRWTPMEYQCRNWYYYCWLSGDQIVEMVIHQIDLMNWALGARPVSALAQGGRLKRTGDLYGNIYDHMSVSYEYPGGVQVHLMCRQWDKCARRNENRVVGTMGHSDSRGEIFGANPWKHEESEDPLKRSSVYEHIVLMESIRNGAARNDILDFAADSTLTAILGRESAYTGQVITWDEIESSELDLFPESYQFGPAPERPVPMPGTPRIA